MRLVEVGQNTNLTTAGQVGPVDGSVQLIGFYVNSTSSGTLVLKHVGASGTAIGGTITPAIGFHRYPVDAPRGLHATIASTLDVTFFYTLNS